MACTFQSIGNIPDCDDPCLAAGVGGYIVPERIVINNACQDPDNVNILYMEVAINGVFDYTPSLDVLYIDENNHESVSNVSSRFIFDYKGSNQSPSEFPISTNCDVEGAPSSMTVLLAWDVGLQINNFNSLPEMTLRLSMGGEFDTDLFAQDIIDEISEIFQSSDPVEEYLFIKGPSAVPYALYYDEDTDELKLQYAGLGNIPCVCSINCGDLTVDGQTLEICDDEIQEVSVTTASVVGDPLNISITFTDAIGNITDLSAHLVHQTIPRNPEAFFTDHFGDCVQVVPFFVSSNGKVIDMKKVTYQIWKYTNTEDNVELLQDWSTKRWTTYFDREIRLGNTYGYAVRFKGEFGEPSFLSSWRKVTSISSAATLTCDQDFGSFITPTGELNFGTYNTPLESCDGGTW
jgi:hypothetical protein